MSKKERGPKKKTVLDFVIDVEEADRELAREIAAFEFLFGHSHKGDS